MNILADRANVAENYYSEGVKRGGETAPIRRRATIAAAAAVCATLLAAPVPAPARVVVTVEVAYGGIVAGGVGVFIYFGSSWEVPFAAGDLPTALVEITPGRTRFGVPLPSLGPDPGQTGSRSIDALHLDLVRWRF